MSNRASRRAVMGLTIMRTVLTAGTGRLRSHRARYRTAAGLGIVSAALLAPLMAPAAQAAAPAPAATPLTAAAAAAPVAAPASAVTASSTPAVDTFWTAARMRTATPREAPPATPAQVRRASASVPRTGSPVSIAPARPLTTTAPGVPAPRRAPLPATVNYGHTWPGAASQTPTRTTGKVFFRDARGGTWVCSGSSVATESRLVVFTAGHCVFDLTTKSYYRNWTYVPGYKNGSAPYGSWTARELWTLKGWHDGTWPAAIPYDTAAAVLNLRSGKRIQNVVGGNGVSWNQPATQTVYALGYPAESPFNGQTLRYCLGTTFTDANFGSRGLGCTMNGGSSGGPWLRAYNSRSGYGYLNGNTSYSYQNNRTRLYAPYYGSAQGALYNAVRHRYQ
jgi:V8-like Glu-specific endopeptidase